MTFRLIHIFMTGCFVIGLLLTPMIASADEIVSDDVLRAQAERVEVIHKVSQHTIAIFDPRGQGGGSGVVISADGYALTNFHVTSACGPSMKCGMADGKLYDAVIVGIDPTGDVSLIKLLGRDDFPTAELGDSDAMRIGDSAIVVGNPFLLAEDFQPTVTYGIISGTHRYQYPAGTLLEYADCLQTDASINPGNSGGPLFNAAGQLIGINGRGSFEKRGRVNVGVGYAISINQIKRFLGYLHSGRIVDHASLGATLSTDDESGRVSVDEVLEESDAYRRGLRYGDTILRFGNRRTRTVNDFKNALGTYPSGWRVPVLFEHEGEQFARKVRLSGVHSHGELMELIQKKPPKMPQPGTPPGPGDEKKPALPELPHAPKAAPLPKVVKDHYEARPGYANYWFNRYHQQRLWNAILLRGDFSNTKAVWKLVAKDTQDDTWTIQLSSQAGSIVSSIAESTAEFGTQLTTELGPPRSGGMLQAMHVWQRLLVDGPRRLGDVYYQGTVPLDNSEQLVDCLVSIYGGAKTQFYLSRETGDLIGLEFFAFEDADPCEILFSDFRLIEDRHLPHQWKVRVGDLEFATLKIESYQIEEKKSSENKPAEKGQP